MVKSATTEMTGDGRELSGATIEIRKPRHDT